MSNKNKQLGELIKQLESAAGVENQAAELFDDIGVRHAADKLDVAAAKSASNVKESHSILKDKLAGHAAELRDLAGNFEGRSNRSGNISEGDIVTTEEEGRLFIIRHGAGRQLGDGITAVSPDSPVGKVVVKMKRGQAAPVHLPDGKIGKITLK